MKREIAIFWFRRDLRLNDNVGLHFALQSGLPVLPIFIFDEDILQKLENKWDRRVDFIHQAVERIKLGLKKLNSDILVLSGKPEEVWEKLFLEYDVKAIFTNHDYEKYGLNRDKSIQATALAKGAKYSSFKDQCVFEKTEILSGGGTPYTVFSPYARKWKETLAQNPIQEFSVKAHSANFIKDVSFKTISLEEIGFKKTDMLLEEPLINQEIIEKYKDQRDFPAIAGTTRLSVHLRFGTISVRKAVKTALTGHESWLNELIWRDFYFNILANFPHIAEGKSFKIQYDNIKWRNNEDEFQKWCDGNTGFPIVDAGIRELNSTGFMHNRVRMIVASFLCKDLLIDWRWGEAYFAQKLNDFDFSANNGGWQWASGSGCDAAPYFRVFNPDSQTLKFDKDLKYIRKWVPEFNSLAYKQMLDHKMARDRALKTYKEGLA
jgi:deoxyribodipyrimidine photo-lyase